LGQTIDRLKQGEEIGSEVVGDVQTAPSD